MVEVKLHDIGEGMTEGDVLTYFVKVGDHVDVDQPLVEVQTDKMVAELTSPTAGVVKEILVATQETIPVGTTILTVETIGGSPKTEKKVEEQLATVEKQSVATVLTTIESPKEAGSIERIIAAPFTRKVAREHDVDLTFIKGTGRRGRITVEDIHRFVADREQQPTKHAPSIADSLPTPKSQKVSGEDEQVETIPFKGRRKQIAMKMSMSLYTIPHVAHLEEIDMTNLLLYRQELKKVDMNLSVVSFFIKALAIALKEYPVFNATLDEENEVIQLKKMVHMGIATDSELGLIVPVLRHVEKKSLLQIQAEMKSLTKKAQDNTLTVEEMTGSTFTISNVGPMGGIGATPIINYPETGLMAFHKTRKMPVVTEDDEIVIRSIMNVTMTFDHRVTDGATVAAFTNRFKAMIENPQLLMLELI
ncbi:2-oxo acid dehydrogenase subunit E2 [Sporosarcina sp. ACRSM]|uniref:dihydrolipoamide acetyltransferase family protein n=1 Tax=Sporosarcina sp. ACRSM TaxID=2918216 RepID=UPI001EF6C01F|nr:dihydrolipoamide acetyltransferase family protein [Sporosarcina sp. ACRSM]MCG7335762.1 2-oxo acid dehydrogenase subunit E2 [Sporosarcina sp. ACRSM]